MPDDILHPAEADGIIPAPCDLSRRNIDFTISAGRNHPNYPAYFHYTEDLLFFLEKIHRLHEKILLVLSRATPFFISRVHLNALEQEFYFTMDMAGFNMLGDDHVFAVECTPEGQKCFKKTGQFYHRFLDHNPHIIQTADELFPFWESFYPYAVPVSKETGGFFYRREAKPIYLPRVKPGKPFFQEYHWRYSASNLQFICPVYPDLHKQTDRLFSFLEQETRIPPLIRIAIFHFFFGYLHPLPMHNAVILRYLTVCQLYEYFHDLSFLPFSWILSLYYRNYYAVFLETEKTESEGNLTHFIYAFLFLLCKAMERSLASLLLVKELVEGYVPVMDSLLSTRDSYTRTLAERLMTHTLICKRGITRKDILAHIDSSHVTVDDRLASFPRRFLIQSATNHPSRFKINMEEILNFVRDNAN